MSTTIQLFVDFSKQVYEDAWKKLSLNKSDSVDIYGVKILDLINIKDEFISSTQTKLLAGD